LWDTQQPMNHRPKFLIGCILPVSCIHRINEEQAWYDRDPERAERIYRQREEDRQIEQQREQEEQERQ